MTGPTPEDRGHDSVLVDDRPPATDEPSDDRLLARAAGVIRAPTATFHAINRDEPLGQAVAVVVAVTALLAAGQAIGVLTDPQAGAAPVAAVLAGGLIVGLPLGLVSFVVWTAAVLLFARVLGGEGGFRTTACGLGFAYVPLVLAAIVSALSLPFGTGAVVVVYPAFLAAGLWSYALDVVAVREVHDLTTGRAVAAVLLPIVLFFLVLILVFGALVAALFTTA